MKGRFGTPLWVIPVLAMVMAIGAFAVFAGINQFLADPAEASIREAGQGLSSNVDLEKLSEPFKSPQPINAVTAVTGGVTVDPDDPGEATRLEVQFATTAGPLNPGTGRVTVRMVDDEWQVPTTLDRNQVTISASAVTTPPGATQTGSADQAVAPQAVNVTFEGTENDEPQIVLTVPDMDTDDNTGANGIAAGAVVTIVFQQSAGILNPSETESYDIRVRTNATGDETLTTIGAVDVPLLLNMDTTADPRGVVVTFLALGVIDGTTATFFRDENGDDNDAGEQVLCRAEVGADDTATCTYTMANPPFTPGFGTDCVGDFTGPGGTYVPGSLSNCNYVNVFDGEDHFATKRDQDDLDNTTFELEPTIRVSPSTANIGDRVTVSLFDYNPGSTLPADGTLGGGGVSLGGIGVATPNMNATSVAANGQANFTMTIPAGVPLGTQRLDVEDSEGGAQDVTVTVGGARLDLSHQNVIANQDLTITGNGFTEGQNICVVEGGITLSNVPLQIDDSNDCPAAILTPTGAERGILLTGGGTFTATVRIEQTNGQIPSALLTEGPHELKVTDTNGAEGTINVTIVERTLEVNPLAARPRDIVTIIGRNFVADNPDGLSSTVQVEYDCGAGASRSVTADPDVSGNFRETLRIPTNCTIPSTNTLRAEIFAGAQGSTGEVDTLTHEIPDALIRIEPARGASGTPVNVIGEGFRTFETVSAIDFGNRGTIGGRTINTDGQGNFRAEGIVVPGLDPGIHAVRITVGDEDDPNRVTSSTSFEVLAESFAGAITSDSEEVFGDVPTLERAWLFDNTSKEWQFFDSREEFTDVNSLLQVPSSAPVWMLVTENTQVELNGQPFNLTCVNPGTPEEDCWNLIVFP